MVSCNVITPQIFWFKWARTSIPIMFVASLLVNVGMWFERFVIIVTSLAQDFVPSSWGYYKPTWVDIGMLVGSFGLFLTLFLLFVRYLPVIAISEVKAIMPQANPHGGAHGRGGVAEGAAAAHKEVAHV
jgi:molybdopterin-containing oxidoreductase family membrane subunit